MQRVGIVGLGCIGGSLGLALAEKPGWHVIGYDTDPDAMEAALAHGVCRSVVDRPEQLPEMCDILVIAVPCSGIARVARELAPFMRPGLILTDTGSVKAPILHQVVGCLPEAVCFIGGHPMAGSEKWGVQHASPRLFEGAIWALTPPKSLAPQTSSIDTLRRMVLAAGAQPILMDAEEHDKAVAVTSHLPYIASLALALAADAKATEHGLIRQLVAGGFRDMTRLARSRPEMASDYSVMNKNHLTKAIDEFERQLATLKTLVEVGDTYALQEAAIEAATYLESVTWGKFYVQNDQDGA